MLQKSSLETLKALFLICFNLTKMVHYSRSLPQKLVFLMVDVDSVQGIGGRSIWNVGHGFINMELSSITKECKDIAKNNPIVDILVTVLGLVSSH